MAHLGRRLQDSASVTIFRLLPSASPPSSYHLDHSDSTLPSGYKMGVYRNFDTPPLTGHRRNTQPSRPSVARQCATTAPHLRRYDRTRHYIASTLLSLEKRRKPPLSPLEKRQPIAPQLLPCYKRRSRVVIVAHCRATAGREGCVLRGRPRQRTSKRPVNVYSMSGFIQCRVE